MKKFNLLLILVFVSSFLFAQRVDVIETNGSFGKDSHPALSTKVLFSDSKTVSKEFMSMMKGYSPESVTLKKGMMFIDNAKIASLSANTVDVYALISQEKNSDQVDLVVAFDLGGIFVTSSQSPSQYQSAYQLIKAFANDLTEKNHTAMLKSAIKNIDKEVKRLDSYEKKQSKMQKDIESYKTDILKAEKKIQKTTTKLSENKTDIERQRVVVRDLKSEYKKLDK